MIPIGIEKTGLSGKLRAVGHLENRLKEAVKLGFKRCILPKTTATQTLDVPGIKPIFVRSVPEAIQAALT